MRKATHQVPPEEALIIITLILPITKARGSSLFPTNLGGPQRSKPIHEVISGNHKSISRGTKKSSSLKLQSNSHTK